MTAGTLMELRANLKALNLSNMARNLEGLLRQTKESGIGYDEFLLDLTGAELQARAESRLNRRHFASGPMATATTKNPMAQRCSNQLSLPVRTSLNAICI